jgi:dCTP deaminase
MAVLSDGDISHAVKVGELGIEPFRENHLTPNGYDLGIAEILIPGQESKVDQGTSKIPPLARFIVSTEEVVRLGPHLTAQLWLRTTWIRRGVIASFGKVDSGFRGTLTLPAFNSSSEPLSLDVGQTFAQIVFERLESKPMKLYAERSGNYQDQRGITLGKP